MNNDCGLSPLNGVNAKFGLVDRNVALPVPSAVAGAGALPRSQSVVGLHPFTVGETPSHCSTKTCAPAVNPVATMVNGSGFPDASPGTTKGAPVGCEMVDAQATPATQNRPTTAAIATTTTRRLLERMETNLPVRRCHSDSRTRSARTKACWGSSPLVCSSFTFDLRPGHRAARGRRDTPPQPNAHRDEHEPGEDEQRNRE